MQPHAGQGSANACCWDVPLLQSVATSGDRRTTGICGQQSARTKSRREKPWPLSYGRQVAFRQTETASSHVPMLRLALHLKPQYYDSLMLYSSHTLIQLRNVPTASFVVRCRSRRCIALV